MLIPSGFLLAKYRFRRVGDNDEMIFTMGHDFSAAINVVADLLFDALRDTFYTAGSMPTGDSFVGVDVVGGSQASGEGPYFNFSSTLAAVAGTAVGQAVPQNTSLLVHKQTDEPGRRNQGRAYLPCILTTAQLEEWGALTTITLTAFQTAINSWHTRLLADALDPVLFHSEAPATPATIDAFVVDPVVATQRRRLRH